MTRNRHDVVIIGAGIAGASLAYRLSERGITDVLVVEREPRPGYHASGRSAATFLTFSPDPFERRAVVASGEFLREPPPEFGAIFNPTGIFLLFDEPDWAEAKEVASALASLGQPVEIQTPHEIAANLPVVARTDVAGGIYLPRDGRLNVPRLLESYIEQATRRGVAVSYATEVLGIRVENGACVAVVTKRGELATRCVVNAAGAWAGQLGQLAGATRISFQSCRRTVITFDAPSGMDVTGWPLVCYESRGIYFAPEADGLLACPMDEEPVPPCDAVPDPSVVGATRTRLAEVAPALAPTDLRSSRAGLRTFASDRGLVLGEDPELRGFFWLAGQGGWGIEGSPVVSQIAAQLIADGTTSWREASALSPGRFAR